MRVLHKYENDPHTAPAVAQSVLGVLLSTLVGKLHSALIQPNLRTLGFHCYTWIKLMYGIVSILYHWEWTWLVKAILTNNVETIFGIFSRSIAVTGADETIWAFAVGMAKAWRYWRLFGFESSLLQRRRSRTVMVQQVAVRSRVRGRASPCDDLKIPSVNPTVNGYLFRIRKDKAAKGEGWILPFICCA